VREGRSVLGPRDSLYRHRIEFGELDKALKVEEGPVVVNIRINGKVELTVSWAIAEHLSRITSGQSV
jgi:acetolactate synthase-1/2/3 large subunit